MPRARRAPGRRPRARAKAVRPAAAMGKIIGLALDMEEPLSDAAELVLALRLIGHGLAADRNDDGQAIVAVARAALARLEEVRERWSEMVK